MARPSLVVRRALAPALAVVGVLGPSFVGCHDEDGLSAEVRLSVSAPSVEFTTDRGYQVKLTRAEVSIQGAELRGCAGARRPARRGGGVAWAHSTATATSLGVSRVVSLLEATAAPVALGTLAPPPGAYCALRLALAPADGDADGLPDEAMVGVTLRMEGTYRAAGSTQESPLRGTTAGKVSADGALTLTLSADGVERATVTAELGRGAWLDGLELSQATPEQIGAAALGAVAAAARAEAR